MTKAERVNLQRAAEEDAPWLAEVCSRAYSGHIERSTHIPGGLSRVDNPRSHLKFMEYFNYYKVTLGDFTVGGLMVAPRGPINVEVVNIFVDPDHQRKGVASTALREVEEQYPEASLWTLAVSLDDEPSTSLVERAGYARVGQVTDDDGTLLNWYHKTDAPLNTSPVGSLREGMKNVIVEGVIQEKAYARAVRGRRPGESLSVAEVGLGDESGRVVLTLWNQQIKMIQVGDRVRVENGFVGGYRGITQLSAGKTGRIVKLDAVPTS
jgi:GNAT superfamily N-acetyltransferase